MITKQCLEVEAQGRIIATGFVQVGATLAGGQLQGRGEDGHFTVGRRVHGRLNTSQYNECPKPQLSRANHFRMSQSHGPKSPGPVALFHRATA
jgi:hypothetical protein